MDKQTPTDATLRAKALARWENEGGAPVDEYGETTEPQRSSGDTEPQSPAADHWH
jgi:hypothetical protein